MWTKEKLLAHYERREKEDREQKRLNLIREIKEKVSALAAELEWLETCDQPCQEWKDRVSLEDQARILNDMVEQKILSAIDRDIVNPKRMTGLWVHPDNVRFLYSEAGKREMPTELVCRQVWSRIQ